MKAPKKIAYLLAALLFASTSTLSSANTITELVGKDRYETAKLISEEGWASGAKNVVLINSYAISDALSAGPYAKKLNAPVLLTSSDKLNKQTEQQLKKLKTENITIIGGENSVSKTVENYLKSNGYKVNRVSGDDRYLTSINIAQKMNLNAKGEVMLVNGKTGLADAAGAGAAAAKLNVPLIFTNGKTADSFKKTTEKLKVKKVYFIGGLNSIPKSFENIFNQKNQFERIAGQNRSETNAKLINKFYSKNIPLVYFAKDGQQNPNELIDSVALASLAGKNNAPIVLVNQKNKTSKAQDDVLKSKNTNKFTAVGGNLRASIDKVNKIISEKSSGSSGSSSSSSSSSSKKPSKKIVENNIYNLKGLEKNEFVTYSVVKLNEEADQEKVIKDLFKERSVSVFKPFEDSKTLLIVTENDKLTKNDLKVKGDINLKTVGNLQAGIYSDDIMSLIIGENKATEKLAAKKYFIGLDQNSSVDVGLNLAKNTKYIGNIIFNVEKTANENLEAGAIIGTVGDRPSDITIQNNTFDFGAESEYALKAISIAPNKTLPGKILIQNNTFKGNNAATKAVYHPNGTADVSIIERAKQPTDITIKDNTFKDQKNHAIASYLGQKENMKIENNTFNNQGEDCILISKFEGTQNLTIKNNVINSFGTKKVMKKDWVTMKQKEVSDLEEGIRIDLIDKAYGLNINDEFFMSINDVVKQLVKNNKIVTKENNDKTDGVMDSHEAVIGRTRNFKNPVEEINKYSSYPKTKPALTIIKNDAENIVYGFDPANPTKKIQVEALTIIGSGSGNIELSPNLVISGDLNIDLPKATLKNSATVNGKSNVKVSGNDQSAATIAALSGSEFTKGSATEDLIVEIKDVKNSKGEAVNKQLTNISNGVVVKVDNVELEKANYTIDDNADTVSIKKAYLNTLTENVKLSVLYSDSQNKVTNVLNANMNIVVSDKSSATIKVTEGAEFIVAHANDKGATISISNIKDKFGKDVSKQKSKLSNLTVKRWDTPIDEKYYTVDESTDTIKLSQEYLNTLETNTYGYALNVSFDSVENDVNTVSQEIRFVINNYSIFDVENISGEVITIGHAPKEGMTFKIRDAYDCAYNKLKQSETNLVGSVKIIPFPVNWSQIEGVGGLKPEFYTIDDVNDTITLNQKFLNTLKDKEEPTYINITIEDKKNNISYRCPKKLPIMLKDKEKERDNSVVITSKEEALNIEEKNITSKNVNINTDMTVKQFLANIKKGNDRQTLRVYKSGNEANLSDYKSSYMKLNEGDKLLVTAENGVDKKWYNLTVVNEEDLVSTCLEIKNSDVISSISNGTIKVKNKNITKQQFLSALTIKNNATVKLSIDEIELENSDKLNARTIVKVSVGDSTDTYKVAIEGKAEYRALLIGNYDYEGDKMDLVGPLNDLNRMESMMGSSEFENGNTISVSKKTNVTEKQLKSAITETFSDAKDNDVSYFYYSGHGNRKNNTSYLCTLGAKSEEDWVNVDELEEILSKVPGKKVVILDSCNSGGFIGKEFTKITKDINENENFNKNIVETFKAAKRGLLTSGDFKVITASSSNEYSFESKIDKMGKFTKAFTEGCGLNNLFKADVDDDKFVSLMEAFNYTSENTSSTSHIQVYPYNDNSILFGNALPENEVKSSSTDVISESFKVVNDTRKAILSQSVTIDY